MPGPRTEDEHLGLDRPFDRPRFDGRRCLAQVGCARARTWSRVTFMLCDSPACFWSAGTIWSAVPRVSNPHSHRTTHAFLIPTTRRIVGDEKTRSIVKPVTQTSTFEDAANVAAWRRHAASRAAFLAPSTARMLRLARLAPGHHVLVVGAGTGEEALLAAARVGAAGQVVATDVSAAMIAEAKRSVAAARVANVRCLVMDAQDLKFRAGAFDAVIARNSLMFIPDLSLALSEMNRVLKPDGRIAATVWAAARRNPRMLSLLDAARALGVKPPPNTTFRLALRLSAPAQLGAALRKAGFTNVVVQRQPLVARFDTVDEAVGVVLDSGGAR
jgi:ubiquinone/menaquinone biosynthesis C-methylase UbiE